MLQMGALSRGRVTAMRSTAAVQSWMNVQACHGPGPTCSLTRGHDKAVSTQTNGRVMVVINMPVLGSLQGPVGQPGGRLGCSIAHAAQHSLQIHLQGQGQRDALQSTGCLHHFDEERTATPNAACMASRLPTCHPHSCCHTARYKGLSSACPPKLDQNPDTHVSEHNVAHTPGAAGLCAERLLQRAGQGSPPLHPGEQRCLRCFSGACTATYAAAACLLHIGLQSATKCVRPWSLLMLMQVRDHGMLGLCKMTVTSSWIGRSPSGRVQVPQGSEDRLAGQGTVPNNTSAKQG